MKQVFYKGVDLRKRTREELNLSTPSTTSSPALIRLKQPILFVLRFFILFFWTPEIILLIKVAFGKLGEKKLVKTFYLTLFRKKLFFLNACLIKY